MTGSIVDGRSGADARFVPVDRRWFGMDRRALLPATVVAAVAAVMAVLLPVINTAVPQSNPIVAGDVLELAGGVTMAPATDWELVSGLRQGDPSLSAGYPNKAIVESADIRFQVNTAPFDGGADDLLARVNTDTPTVDLGPAALQAMSTRGGLNGIIRHQEGSDFDSTTAAFVTGDGIGVTVRVVGGADLDGESIDREIYDMIDSLGSADGMR